MDPAQLPKGAILVIRELTPSMAVKIDPAKTQGIIAETGGYTSHAAILARALGIPAVLGVTGALAYIENGKTLILESVVLFCKSRTTIQKKSTTRKPRCSSCKENG